MRQRFLRSSSNQVIEVFDVVLQSKMRLVMFDFESGQEMLLNPAKSNYLQAMERARVKAETVEGIDEKGGQHSVY